MSVIGIDIGTEFSKVAVAFRKKIEMVGNDLSKLQTPTLISYGKDQRLFGDMALSSHSSNIANTVPQIKRLFGRLANDEKLNEELTNWFLCNTCTLNDGRIGLDFQTTQGQKQLSPEQALAGFLTRLKEFTAKHLEGIPVKDVVIGCPSYFDDAQRRALLTAARLAEFNVLRLMNETTAIALNYGILRQLPENETRRVVFVDIGMSNTQVAVVDFVKGKLTVKYTAANPFAGGREFDMALFNHFAEQWKKESGLNVRDNKRVTLRLMKEVNKVKKMLSANKDAVLPLDCFQNDKDFTLRIERQTLEEASNSVVNGICEPLIEALTATKDDNVKIHSVEIVGGPSKIPCIQQSILSTVQKFNDEIKSLSFTLNFNESVARGCALMCAMISPNFKVREFEVTDINTWPVTIEYPSEKGGLTEQLVIQRGNPSPCTAKVTFYKDKAFEFRLRQPTTVNLKDDAKLSIAYPFSTQKEIGKFEVGTVKPSENLVSEPKIKLMLSLNRHGILDKPQATLIEYVKREEPVKPPSNEQTKDAKDASNENKDSKDASNTDNANATTDDKKNDENANSNDTTKPMEVDDNENSESKDNQQPTPMDTDENENDKEKEKDKDNDIEMKDNNNNNNEDEKTKQKRLKKKVTRILTINGNFLNEITNKEFNELHELEVQLYTADRVVVETQEKHNELETYVYDMRDKLDMSHRDFISEDGRGKFSNLLTTIEDWLYGDGEHAQKSEYINKLNELKSFGDPIENRYFESENRENRITNLKKLIFKYQQWVNTKDEKYSHIDENERNKVKDFADNCDKWLMDKQKQQDKLNKWDNPALLCKEIDHQYRELLNQCNPIISKPKPAPPKKEEKKEEKKDDATKTDEQQTQNNENNANAESNANSNTNTNADANTNANTNDATANANANNNESTNDATPNTNKDNNETKPDAMEIDG